MKSKDVLAKATKVVVVGTALGLIAYDLFALIRGGVEDTESNFIITNGTKFLIIPFGAGILAQHFFSLL